MRSRSWRSVSVASSRETTPAYKVDYPVDVTTKMEVNSAAQRPLPGSTGGSRNVTPTSSTFTGFQSGLLEPFVLDPHDAPLPPAARGCGQGFGTERDPNIPSVPRKASRRIVSPFATPNMQHELPVLHRRPLQELGRTALAHWRQITESRSADYQAELASLYLRRWFLFCRLKRNYRRLHRIHKAANIQLARIYVYKWFRHHLTVQRSIVARHLQQRTERILEYRVFWTWVRYEQRQKKLVRAYRQVLSLQRVAQYVVRHRYWRRLQDYPLYRRQQKHLHLEVLAPAIRRAVLASAFRRFRRRCNLLAVSSTGGKKLSGLARAQVPTTQQRHSGGEVFRLREDIIQRRLKQRFLQWRDRTLKCRLAFRLEQCNLSLVAHRYLQKLRQRHHVLKLLKLRRGWAQRALLGTYFQKWGSFLDRSLSLYGLRQCIVAHQLLYSFHRWKAFALAHGGRTKIQQLFFDTCTGPEEYASMLRKEEREETPLRAPPPPPVVATPPGVVRYDDRVEDTDYTQPNTIHVHNESHNPYDSKERSHYDPVQRDVPSGTRPQIPSDSSDSDPCPLPWLREHSVARSLVPRERKAFAASAERGPSDDWTPQQASNSLRSEGALNVFTADSLTSFLASHQYQRQDQQQYQEVHRANPYEYGPSPHLPVGETRETDITGISSADCRSPRGKATTTETYIAGPPPPVRTFNEASFVDDHYQQPEQEAFYSPQQPQQQLLEQNTSAFSSSTAAQETSQYLDAFVSSLYQKTRAMGRTSASMGEDDHQPVGNDANVSVGVSRTGAKRRVVRRTF